LFRIWGERTMKIRIILIMVRGERGLIISRFLGDKIGRLRGVNLVYRKVFLRGSLGGK